MGQLTTTWSLQVVHRALSYLYFPARSNNTAAAPCAARLYVLALLPLLLYAAVSVPTIPASYEMKFLSNCTPTVGNCTLIPGQWHFYIDEPEMRTLMLGNVVNWPYSGVLIHSFPPKINKSPGLLFDRAIIISGLVLAFLALTIALSVTLSVLVLFANLQPIAIEYRYLPNNISNCTQIACDLPVPCSVTGCYILNMLGWFESLLFNASYIGTCSSAGYNGNFYLRAGLLSKLCPLRLSICWMTDIA
jgi:hypothetical protein